ncbi:MAG: hypothetical protein AAF682_19535 [Planctomycetota bacterium]
MPTKTTKKNEPDPQAAAEEPDEPEDGFKPERGGSCAYTYLRNGPRIMTCEAEIVAVRKDGNLDLRVSIPGGREGQSLVDVPRDESRSRGRTWSAPR